MESLHLAYSATDSDTGLTQDITLLVDSAPTTEEFRNSAMSKLEQFLRTAGIISPRDCLRTTTA